MMATSLLLAKGFCHTPTSHVAALKSCSSREWGPRARASLKTWASPAGSLDVRRGGPGPYEGSRGYTWRSRTRPQGANDILGGLDPLVQFLSSSPFGARGGIEPTPEQGAGREVSDPIRHVQPHRLGCSVPCTRLGLATRVSALIQQERVAQLQGTNMIS